MTQKKRETTGAWEPTPTQVVAQRVRELRTRHGWSAQVLAERCADAGMPHLVRDVIANLEAGRRETVTIDEVMLLAYVLDVAVVDLIVPPENRVEHHKYGPVDLWGYRVTPATTITGLSPVRRFVSGEGALAGMDKRRWQSERPDESGQPSAADVLAYLQSVLPKGDDDGQH